MYDLRQSLRRSPIKLGPLTSVTIFGGYAIAFDCALWLERQGVTVRLITAPRQAAEIVQGTTTFLEMLQGSTLSFEVVEDIQSFCRQNDTTKYSPSDLAISIGAAWIFSNELITKHFSGHILNSHGYALPQNRGGAGISWQILRRNRLGYCLVHCLEAGVDTGAILAYEEFLYPPHCKRPSEYAAVYNKENTEFLCTFFQKLIGASEDLTELTQPEYLSSYWPRLNTDLHSWIDWSMNVGDLDAFISAFDEPYSGAQTVLGDQEVRLKKSHFDFHQSTFHPFQSGMVFRNNAKWICVAAPGGTLIVEDVFSGTGERITHKIRPGDRFYTPSSKLDEAKSLRVSYTANGPVTK
ncbi:MAG: hypothetical protein KDD60_07700 [Bdellovibrionales bacterium]|nr:hypothetical protein [Bdellovibrionales bacterium]